MKTNIKFIKFFSITSIVAFIACYITSLVAFEEPWLNSNFLFSIFSGVFASFIVVLITEIKKYFDNKSMAENSYQHKERHILLNSNMDYITVQMVCGHEIGHDIFHREKAKSRMGLQEFTLFDMRSEMEYEANAFAAHLRIDSEELLELAGHGYDVVQLSSIMGTNVNLVLIKLNELNRMGLRLDLPYVPRSDFLKNVKNVTV